MSGVFGYEDACAGKGSDMSEKERQAIVKALEAIASALSFCETDHMMMVMRDRLDVIHDAIGELRETACQNADEETAARDGAGPGVEAGENARAAMAEPGAEERTRHSF